MSSPRPEKPPGRHPAVHQGPIIGLLVILLLLFVLLTQNVALPWAVQGLSMAPTLEPGDRVLVDPWSYRYRAPRAGEIVLLRGPVARPEWLVKRVAAAPSGADRPPEPGPWGGVRSPEEGGVWVLGDNAGQSLDSRRFGPVPRERLIGRVFWRYWPLRRAGRIPGPEAVRRDGQTPRQIR